jgi:hypothetical protein
VCYIHRVPETASRVSRFSPVLWISLGLFALALLLRLLGIGWGLPNDLRNQSLHPDELPIFSYSRQIEPTRLNFAPGFYNYGTLYLTVLRITGDVVAGYGGGPDPARPESLWEFAGRVHLAGRVLNAFLGAGTAVVLFLLLARFLNLFGATMGGLLLAVAPGHVVHSRFQTVDVPAVFLLVLSAYFALRLLPDREGRLAVGAEATKFAVLSGVFAGLSAGTKYTGILGLLTLAAALILARSPGWAKTAGYGALAALGAFILTTPGILLDSGAFFRDFVFEITHTRTGHGLVFAGTSPGFMYHLGNLGVGVGVVATLLGLAGIVWGAANRQAWMLALLVFFLPYYLLIGRAEVKFLRYTFPLYIGLAAGFGYAVARGHERKGWGAALVVGGMFAVAGFDFGGMRGAGTMTGWAMQPDPRDEAARYLRQVQPAGRVGMVMDPWFWSVPLFPDSPLGPIGAPFTRRLDWLEAQAEPPAVVVREADGSFIPWNPRLVAEVRPERVVFTSFEYLDVYRLRGVPNLPPDIEAQVERAAAFEEVLRREYRLERLYGVTPVQVHDLMYIRPAVWVWKRNDLP